MDFSSLEIESTRAKNAAKATVVKFKPLNDEGKPLGKMGGVDLVVDLLPMTSPEGLRELQKWRIKYGKAEDAHPDATEEELDALADAEDVRSAELAARVVAGWNIKGKDGKDVPCTLENRKAFFENKAFAPVAVAVMNEVTRVSDALGNSKKA